MQVNLFIHEWSYNEFRSDVVNVIHRGNLLKDKLKRKYLRVFLSKSNLEAKLLTLSKLSTKVDLREFHQIGCLLTRYERINEQIFCNFIWKVSKGNKLCIVAYK